MPKKPAHSLETYSHNFYAQGAEPALDNIRVERLRPEAPTQPVPRDDVCLVYFSGGVGVLRINGQAQAVRAGMMARLFAYHRYAIEPQGALELWRVQFPLSVLMYLDVKKRFTDTDYSAVESGNPLAALPKADQAKVEDAFAEMQGELREGRPHHLNMVLGDLFRLLAIFDRQCEREREENGPHDRSLAWQALQRIHMYFNMERMDAYNVAVDLGVDVRRLGYLLRRLTGQGFAENLHEVRVRNACAMMMFEELSVAFIARYVGYTSPATFYRVFKGIKGVTPDEYRAKVVVGVPRGAHRDTAWKVLVYLLEHYADAVTPAALEEALFVGRDTVEDICRVNFGGTFAELLEQVRLNYACCLLGVEAIPVSDVALAVGFNTQRTLTRSFKRHLGTTPGRYRRSVLAGTAAAPASKKGIDKAAAP